MCAGTVVEPPGATSAAIVSATSRSRSVALKASLARSALISTFARIGIVLRRSTTRWTWPSDFNSAARSTVTFMSTPLAGNSGWIQGSSKWRGQGHFARARGPARGLIQRDRAPGSDLAWQQEAGTARGRTLAVRTPVELVEAGVAVCGRSLLQLSLEQLDLLREPGVGVDKTFDLAHRMQHRGVVTAAEAPANLRQ